jgi:hypothetical protein
MIEFIDQHRDEHRDEYGVEPICAQLDFDDRRRISSRCRTAGHARLHHNGQQLRRDGGS